jgi:hypothetical protein
MHVQVIRVPIQTLGTKREDHLRPDGANMRYELGGGGLDWYPNECPRMLSGWGSGHSRVTVAEQAHV